MAESESRDGQGAGDHNVVFEFGHPRAGLSLMQQARLLVMRGYVMDRTGAIKGDTDVPTASTAIARYWRE